jgi:putative MATE family efflux protein
MSVKQNDITSGPIGRTVFRLALPVVLGMFMEFALSSTDYFWVGKLGPAAQDAVTSSMVVIWTIFATTAIITVGVTALVARFVGAQQIDQVERYIRQGLQMALVLGGVFTLAGYLATPSLLAFMDTSDETARSAVPYLRLFFGFSVFMFIAETAYAVFRASGDTRTPMLVGVGVILLNMGLDPVLIFGWGPFPELGVPGASLATGIAWLLGSAVIIGLIYRGKLGYQVHRLWYGRPSWIDAKRIGRIGLPMAGQNSVFILVYWFLIKFVHVFGESAGAAMGIGNRMESFSYLTCYGFSVAASTLVGQNIGAGQTDRAERCAWLSIRTAIYVTGVISVLFIVVPEYIATVFTDDPDVMAMAVDYLIILGISQTAMAIEIVLEGAFGGAGDTMPPMLVSIPGSLSRIPLAYFLCFTLDWGINGIWWTLTITTLVKATILGFWFRRGRWKLKAV